MARNVQVRPNDVEVGDTLIGPGAGATFVVNGRRTSVNGFVIFVDASTPPQLWVVQAADTVIIQIP